MNRFVALIIVALMLVVSFAAAQSVNTAQPYHTFQQIARGGPFGLWMADTNSDGYDDHSPTTSAVYASGYNPYAGNPYVYYLYNYFDGSNFRWVVGNPYGASYGVAVNYADYAGSSGYAASAGYASSANTANYASVGYSSWEMIVSGSRHPNSVNGGYITAGWDGGSYYRLDGWWLGGNVGTAVNYADNAGYAYNVAGTQPGLVTGAWIAGADSNTCPSGQTRNGAYICSIYGMACMGVSDAGGVLGFTSCYTQRNCNAGWIGRNYLALCYR